MRKQLVSLCILSLVFVSSLVGCGGGSDGSSSNPFSGRATGTSSRSERESWERTLNGSTWRVEEGDSLGRVNSWIGAMGLPACSSLNIAFGNTQSSTKSMLIGSITVAIEDLDTKEMVTGATLCVNLGVHRIKKPFNLTFDGNGLTEIFKGSVKIRTKYDGAHKLPDQIADGQLYQGKHDLSRDRIRTMHGLTIKKY